MNSLLIDLFMSPTVRERRSKSGDPTTRSRLTVVIPSDAKLVRRESKNASVPTSAAPHDSPALAKQAVLALSGSRATTIETPSVHYHPREAPAQPRGPPAW